MKKSSKRREFDVYDFKEEDEAADKTQLERFRKWRMKPRDEESPVDKVKFLEVFATSTNLCRKGTEDVTCVDVDKTDTEVIEHLHDSYTLCLPLENVIDASDTASDDESSMSSGSTHHGDCHDEDIINMDSTCSKEDFLCENSSRTFTLPISRNGSDCDLSSSFNLKEEDDSGEDDEWTVSSSCHSPDQSGNEGKDHLEIVDSLDVFKGAEDGNMEVVISPDYVLYEQKPYADSRLTFSPHCIRIECLDTHGSDESSHFEWTLESLIKIECLWSHSVESIWVEVQSKTMDGTHGTNGIMTLIFTLFACQWFQHEQKIMSLSPRYKDVWLVQPIIRNAVFPDAFIATDTCFTSRYLIDFKGNFEDVIYPEGDPDAVSVSQRDIELLQPETFINDTIIDFYIMFLRKTLKVEENNRFHFFNCFFFRKLADLDKNPQSHLDGREAFCRVRKWTRKINIFQKDYLLIPVNYNLHWSLLIVCHPGEIDKFEGENNVELNKLPCILHLDSLRGSHNGLKDLMQRYIWEEWKERYPESPPSTLSKFLSLRFISLELPQQENMFDCGLFLLHYVELFLKQAPLSFSIFSITNLSNFLSTEWFVPVEASFKRFLIRDLLYDLLHRESLKGPLCFSNKDCISEYPNDNVVKEQSSKDDGLVEQKPFLRETPSQSFLDCHINFFDRETFSKKKRSLLSPIQEGSEQSPYIDTGNEIVQPTNEICSSSYSRLRYSDVSQDTVPVDKHEDEDCAPENLKPGSQKLFKQSSDSYVKDYRNFPDDDDLVPVKNEEADVPRSLSSGNCEYSHDNTMGLRSGVMLNLNVSNDSRKIKDYLADLNGKGITSSSLEEKLEDVEVNRGVSFFRGIPENCIGEESQRVDYDAGTEEMLSFLPEKSVDVPKNPGASLSGSMLETCSVEDSQEIDANRRISDPLDNCEGLPENHSSISLDMGTCIVNDSQEVGTNSEDDDDGAVHSCQEHHLNLPCQDMDKNPTNNVVSLDFDIQSNSNELVAMPDHKLHKRRKIHHTRNERLRTRSATRNTSL